MDDSLLVRGRQSLRDLLRVVGGFARRERAGTQTLPQRLALQQLRHDVRRTAILANVIDRKNVRMVKCRRRPRFLRKPLQPVRICGKRRWQNLDRHVSVQPGIVGAINLAHAARPNRRLNLIRPQLRPRGKCHRCARL